MNSSEQLNELAPALAKAQAVMTGALKDSANPFFKSKYADLESVWAACRKALTDNGLSVVQGGAIRLLRGTDAEQPVLVTRLLHSSGQWIEGETHIKAKDDGPQAQGSGITYARRYGLAAMVGVYQTDDDAEAAQGRQGAPQGVPNYVVDSYVDQFRAYMNVGDAKGVYELHRELNGKEEVYKAVGDRLDSHEKESLRKCVNAKGILKANHDAEKDRMNF